jgi:long-subunit fatty acid transport protein
LELGAAYRHRTSTHVTNEQGTALRLNFTDVSSDFVLPSKLGVGGRYDLRRSGLPLLLAADVEYSFNSQNEGAPLQGTDRASGMALAVPNVFEWQDSVTLRFGVEYRLLRDAVTAKEHVALRAGYIFDSKVANKAYPTAFGTPPGFTQVVTVGGGYDFGVVQLNTAFAYRTGSATVTNEDLTAPGNKDCKFCGVAGDYAIKLSGIYFDISHEL